MAADRPAVPLGSPEPSDADGRHAEIWRDELLTTLLRWIFVLGLVVAVPSVVQAVRIDEPLVIVADVLALALVATLAFARPLSFAVRAHVFIALMYLFGLALVFSVGVVAQLYLLAVPVMAAVLLSMRRAIAVLVLNTSTLLVVSAVLDADLAAPSSSSGATSDLANWVVITLNFVFVSWILTYSAGRLIGRLEDSLARQQRISSSLEAEQQRLGEANEELRREVADRQRAETEARRMALAIEQSGVAVLICDLGGAVTFTNRAHDALVEQIGADATFRHLDDLIARLESVVETAAEADPGKPDLRPRSGTWVVTDGYGLDRRFAVRIAPLTDADGEGRLIGAVAVMREVTDEVRAQERLRRSERLESLGTLASGTAHDFNNVTAAIRMIAETTGSVSTDPEVIAGMHTIVAACDRARDVVRQMMVFGRQSALSREWIVLRDVVHEALPLVRAALAPGIDLRDELDGCGGIVGHPSEIHQLLMNLVANASSSITAFDGDPPPGGHRVTVAVSDLSSGDVVLEVADTGGGIRSDDLDRVFDPFFTTKPAGEGSGLGLASVHGLVESLGGSVAVESTWGRGATFRVQLPGVEPGDPVAGPPVDPLEVAGGEPPTASILLVEDEDAIRDMAVRHLSRAGHRVTAARDGRHAVEHFDADPEAFDLVVTDLAMPRLDGRALVRHLHGIRPELPVIVSTGFGDPAADDDLVVSGRLAKPYSLADLESTVRTVLERR